MNPRLNQYVILDAKAVMYHCYHIGKDPDAILTERGKEINTAQFAFANFLERYMIPILEYARPYQILIAHDAGTVYRSIIYPEYKIQRKKADKDPEEKAMQNEFFSMMKRFWASIGCTQAKVEGVEADDIIAYFCEALPGNKIVYTTDGDLLQLVNNNTQVMLKCEPQTDGAHKGIPYSLTSISKSMLGDTSDHYKGVVGFGDAKWGDLVEAFGFDGIEELETCVKTKDYKVIEEVLEENPLKALQLLYDNRYDWEVAYDVALLHPELCWKPRQKKITKIEWYKRVPDAIVTKQVLTMMGCAHFYEQFEEYMSVSWLVNASDIDDEFYEDFRQACRDSDLVAFDYETHPSDMALLKTPKGKDNVDVMEALITGVSFNFGVNLNNTIYIPVAHKDSDNVPVSVVGKLLQIAQSESDLSAQNMAFEVAVTKTNLDFWLGKIYDTALMSSYVDENESARLKVMSKQMLNYDQATYMETVTDPETGDIRTMDMLTAEETVGYGCDDSLVTAHLFIQMRIIMQLEGSWDFFEENETESVHSLSDAYLTGCEIDWEALEVQHKKDLKIIDENMVKLRGLLSEHCSKPNVASAEAYVEEEKDFIRAHAKEKIKAQLNKAEIPIEKWGTQVADAMTEAYAIERSKAVDASQYVPYEETYIPPEFKPTVTQINKLLESLGFYHFLEKMTRASMTEWLTDANNFDAEQSDGVVEDYTVAQKRFIRLFGECTSQISKREGEDYETFIKFCTEKSTEEGKIVSTGDELNTGSPQQMAHLLYCKLGLPVRLKNMAIKSKSRTRLKVKGSPQTDALAVETAMAEDTVEGDWKREAMDCIKNIKESKTRCSLYHDPYPLWKSMRDDRIHPQIKDCGTVTRRPTSTSPNILQVSKHQAKGVMRSIYLPYSEEEIIVSIDFSQQELRIMASECGDSALIACYNGKHKTDVHSKTASGIAGVSYENYMVAYKDEDHEKHDEYSTIRKRPAKATNFLLAYMGEADTLSRRLIIPFDDADEMMNSAYATYPGILPWQADVCKFAAKHGFTQTAYGNRRHLTEDILSPKKGARKRIERQAVNFTIQGCAADILKIVLTQCWRTNLWKDTGSTLLGPVYDEITSSVPVSKVVEYINRLVEIMSITPPNHIVPMEADVSLGPNWRDQIEIGIRPSEEKIEEAIDKSLKMKHEQALEKAA